MGFSRQEYWSGLPLPSPPSGAVVKNSPSNAEDTRDADLIPGSGIFPWSRKWQPTPVFLPGESQGEPGGLPSLGSHRVGHDWSDLAARAAPPLGKPICRVHQVKCRAGWITSWNQDCQEKYQQPHICRWYCPNGKKCRVTKKLLYKWERAEWKSWHGIKHSKN